MVWLYYGAPLPSDLHDAWPSRGLSYEPQVVAGDACGCRISIELDPALRQAARGALGCLDCMLTAI